MTNFEEKPLKADSRIGSGGVSQFGLPGARANITRIRTYCPDEIGPGPTNVYVIQQDGALILMDAGIPTHLAKIFFYHWRSQPMPKEIEELSPDHGFKEFQEGVELAGYSRRDLDLVVISHSHPDHYLMAGRILDGTRAATSAHVLDTPDMCNPWGLLASWFSRQGQMMATGMPPARPPRELVTEETLRRLDMESLGVALKIDCPFFKEGPLTLGGAELPGIEVRHIPGHTPGSVGLLLGREGDKKVLLCGDVLLDPITPHPENLLVYLQTLEEMDTWNDVELVLPAHGHAIGDFRSRIAYLRHHHRKRIRTTYEAFREPRCVWDVATLEGYFETYVDPKKFNFLAGLEALVHSEILYMADGLRRTEIKGDVQYFKNSGEPFDEVYGRIMEIVAEKKARTLMRC